MSENRPIEVRTHTPQDRLRLEEETIGQWRTLGAAAAWNAVYDSLDWWFEARGLDPELQRVDRTFIQVQRVPWLSPKT
jgi:hypothetical protein